jgi:TPR repeat protein
VVLGAAWSLSLEWPKPWHSNSRTDEMTAEPVAAPAPPDASSPPAGTGAVPAIRAEPEARAPTAQGVSEAQTSPASPERTATAGSPAPAVNATGASSAHPPARGDGERRDDANRDRLLIKGLRSLVLGNVSSARLLLRRAAEAGDARAALVLGDTFDDVRLVQLGVLGVQPDRAKAVYWYERADALGAPEAKGRLSDLNAR